MEPATQWEKAVPQSITDRSFLKVENPFHVYSPRELTISTKPVAQRKINK